MDPIIKKIIETRSLPTRDSIILRKRLFKEDLDGFKALMYIIKIEEINDRHTPLLSSLYKTISFSFKYVKSFAVAKKLEDYLVGSNIYKISRRGATFIFNSPWFSDSFKANLSCYFVSKHYVFSLNEDSFNNLLSYYKKRFIKIGDPNITYFGNSVYFAVQRSISLLPEEKIKDIESLSFLINHYIQANLGFYRNFLVGKDLRILKRLESETLKMILRDSKIYVDSLFYIKDKDLDQRRSENYNKYCEIREIIRGLLREKNTPIDILDSLLLD